MNDEWQVVKRPSTTPTHEIRPLISFRRSTIGFNSHFVKHATLTQYRYVTMYVMPDKFKVGFKFHNDKSDPNAYTLLKGRSVQVGHLYSAHQWLKGVSELEDEWARRFEPVKNEDGMWEVQVCPAFEIVVINKKKIPENAKGIYRYRRKGEVVYIGRGNIRNRAMSQERKDWEYDNIEYSIVLDENEQQHWESYWLDQHVKEHARKPLYNRIMGKQGNN